MYAALVEMVQVHSQPPMPSIGQNFEAEKKGMAATITHMKYHLRMYSI
jgi:hypothetical protein